MEAVMTMLARILSIKFNKAVICAAVAASGTALVVACAERAKADDPMVTKAAPIPYANPAAYNWNGFYAGGQMDYTWGTSNWTASSPGAPNVSGSLSLAQRIDIFSETGIFFAGCVVRTNMCLSYQERTAYERSTAADASTAGRTLLRVLCLSTLNNVRLHPRRYRQSPRRNTTVQVATSS
jgi:opacity protein-like surface antigen